MVLVGRGFIYFQTPCYGQLYFPYTLQKKKKKRADSHFQLKHLSYVGLEMFFAFLMDLSIICPCEWVSILLRASLQGPQGAYVHPCCQWAFTALDDEYNHILCFMVSTSFLWKYFFLTSFPTEWLEVVRLFFPSFFLFFSLWNVIDLRPNRLS